MKRSKRQTRQLLILCIVLALAIGGYITAVALNKAAERRNQQQAVQNEIVISAMKDIVTLEIHNGAGTLHFTKTGPGEWTVDNLADFPLRPTQLTYIDFDLQGLKADRKLTLTESPEAYGFTDDCPWVKATDSLGNTIDLLVGGETGYKYYYMERGSSTVYIAGSTLAGDLDFTLMEIAQPYSFHEMSQSSLLNVRYTQGGHTTYVDKDVGYDANGNVAYTFYLTRDDGPRVAFDELNFAENVVIDTEKGWYFRRPAACLDVFLNMWEDFYTHSCVTYQPTQTQLEDWGLTRERAYAVVEMDYTWRNVDYHYTLYIGDVVPKEPDSTDTAEYRYAWIEGRSVVETAAAADLEAFNLLYDSLPQGLPG